jgi:hypothetical protein
MSYVACRRSKNIQNESSDCWTYRQAILICSKASRPDLVSRQPPLKWVLGAVSTGVKVLKREAEHPTLCNAEIRNECNYTSTPPYDLVA